MERFASAGLVLVGQGRHGKASQGWVGSDLVRQARLGKARSGRARHIKAGIFLNKRS